VIVPTIALILIAAIPYVDRGTKGLGVWFYSSRGPKVAIFSAIYTTVVTSALIALDKLTGTLKAVFTSWLQTSATATAGGGSGPLSFFTIWVANIMGQGTETAQAEALGLLVEAFAGWIVPIFFMVFFPVLLVILLKRVFPGIDLTEIIIGLFTGFVVVYAVLTFVGSAMRGPGMDLYPPWAVPPTQESC
jgi:hypothetical protein